MSDESNVSDELKSSGATSEGRRSRADILRISWRVLRSDVKLMYMAGVSLLMLGLVTLLAVDGVWYLIAWSTPEWLRWSVFVLSSVCSLVLLSAVVYDIRKGLWKDSPNVGLLFGPIVLAGLFNPYAPPPSPKPPTVQEQLTEREKQVEEQQRRIEELERKLDELQKAKP